MITAVHELIDLFPAPGALEANAAVFHHRLTNSGMFEDRNLVRIIDSHPRDFLDVSGKVRTEGPPIDPATRKRESADLLDAVRQGQNSLVIRNVFRFQPGLQRLVDRLYTELQDKSPGFVPRRLCADLAVAHSDAPLRDFDCETPGIFLQVRGRQRVSISNADGSPASFSRFELQAGDAVMFPMNLRHRFDVLDGLSVSLCTSHYTPRQLRRARVLRANQLLRDALNLPCRSTRTSGLAYALKSSVYFGWQAVQRLRPRFANR